MANTTAPAPMFPAGRHPAVLVPADTRHAAARPAPRPTPQEPWVLRASPAALVCAGAAAAPFLGAGIWALLCAPIWLGVWG